MHIVANSSARRDAGHSYQASLSQDGKLSVTAAGGSEIAASVFLDDQPIADAFWSSLSPRLADFGDIAVAVYAADRLCRRPNPQSLDWAREMEIEVPVREPQFWQGAVVSSQLQELLTFLTDDAWSIRFVQRRGEARASENPTLFEQPLEAPASAALFSGGLDSLAGLIAFLTENPSVNVATFSAQTGKRIGKPQREQLRGIARIFPGRVTSAKASFGFRNRIGHNFDGEERSQRTRGFAFQTFGVIAASLAGANDLMIFENGVGAINLPYIESQLGSQCTRATNPVTLNMMSDLASSVLGTAFRVWLPYVLRTKGELCESLRATCTQSLISESVSCDHFALRVPGCDQCGACGSCLLRRQSLHTSKLGAYDRAAYLHAAVAEGEGPKHDGWFVLHAMDAQVSRLRQGCVSADPSNALLEAFPMLGEACVALSRDGIEPRELSSLFGRYCIEWEEFRATHKPPLGAVGR